MLQGLRKKAKQREERREAMEAEAGVVTGRVSSARRKSTQTPRGRGGRSGGGGGGSDRGGSSSRCACAMRVYRADIVAKLAFAHESM